MTVRNLLVMDTDVDVYDDYDERLGVAFCGPMALTDNGMEKFADALDLPVTLIEYSDSAPVAVVHVDDDVERLNLVTELFDSLAGMCYYKDYDRWFKEYDQNTIRTEFCLDCKNSEGCKYKYRRLYDCPDFEMEGEC